jgi:hypothetical protein
VCGSAEFDHHTLEDFFFCSYPHHDGFIDDVAILVLGPDNAALNNILGFSIPVSAIVI